MRELEYSFNGELIIKKGKSKKTIIRGYIESIYRKENCDFGWKDHTK